MQVLGDSENIVIQAICNPLAGISRMQVIDTSSVDGYSIGCNPLAGISRMQDDQYGMGWNLPEGCNPLAGISRMQVQNRRNNRID